MTVGLGENGAGWDFQRIGTLKDVSTVEKEVEEIRKRLAHAEILKKRRAEIERELNKCWMVNEEPEPSSAFEKKDHKDEKERDNDDDRTIVEIEDSDSDEDIVQDSGKIESDVSSENPPKDEKSS